MKVLPIITIILATFCVVKVSSQLPKTNYPSPDKVPDTNSPEVQAWLKEVDLSNVPDLPISNGGKVNTQQIKCGPPTVIVPEQGSWTCQKFTAPDDIVTCPQVGHWGLTYDDGPSVSTPKLINKLNEHDIKATFFVVGSRVIQHPETIVSAYLSGHNIAVHTWSHPALTSLSNEAIVAELKWTIQAIKDVIGVTPLYMRPPYGDTDNRVRAVARACGLKTVLWLEEFDSNDWALTATPPKSIDFVLETFEKWMQMFPKLSTGFIVLEHDLYPETVEAAIQIIDRAVKVPNLKITSVPQCIGDDKPYVEGSGSNSTIPDKLPKKPKTSLPSSASVITVPLAMGPIIPILSSLLNL